MSERIRQLRELLNMSQDEFANKLGLKSRGKIANIEYGKTVPDDAFLQLICATFNVNETWLRTGEGDAFRELSLDEELAAFFGDVIRTQPDDFKKRFFSVLSKLPESDWEVLLNLAESLAKRKD